MTYYLDAEKLANLVHRKRASKGLRDAAQEISRVSPSTLSRVENGKIPDLKTFFALCDWLETSPTEFIRSNNKETNKPGTTEAAAEILIKLRADERLDSSVVDVLSSFIKVAYRDFARKDKSEVSKHKEDVVSSSQYALSDLLAGARSEDFTGEYDWGRPMGREVW